MSLEYFNPKSFIVWSTPDIGDNLRCGHFTITPCNDQYNSEFYWCYSTCKDGKYRAYANRNCEYTSNISDFILNSPWFSSEEKAIKWLEKKFMSLSRKKIKESNRQLRSKISANNSFIKNLIGTK